MLDADLIFPDAGGDGPRIEPMIKTVDEDAAEPFSSTESDDPLVPRPGYLGVSVTPRRATWFFAAILATVAVLVVRAGMLDLWKGAAYRRQAEGNRLRVVPVASDRGIIDDRTGRLLVRNIPDFTLTVTPADLPKDEQERMALIAAIAEQADMTPVDIEHILQRYPATFASAVPIKEHLDYSKALLLDVQSGTLPGVDLNVGTKRQYILDDPDTKQPLLSMSHVLGYEGRISDTEYARLRDSGYYPTDTIGKAGVESSYETQLRGAYGRKQIEVDALGREQSVLAEDTPAQGKDITLTIDTELQGVAERALRKSAALNGRGRGVAIAMDPKTGEILALVSLPGFDANDFAKGISLDEYRQLAEDPNQPLFPRAVSGLYPPGSTVKLVISAAALAEGVITPSTTVLSTGGLHVGQWFFPDWKAGGHGTTNVIKAIAESVNTFFYMVGGGWEGFKGLGVARLRQAMLGFGLGKKLGIDLPGERDGFVPSEDWKQKAKGQPWFIGDTYHMSIGQGDLLVTPLQVAAWTSVFANGGMLVTPHVVQSVGGAPTEMPQRRVAEPDVVETVRKGMRQTVLAGSAQSLKLSPWPMAGKTGTAQWRQGQPNHAWFTGFAPFDDPQIQVTVLIEAGGEGSHSAVPVAREIMEAWLRKQKVPAAGIDWSATGSNEVFHD